MQLVVRNLCGSVFFGCGGVGTQDSLGLVRYAGSSELFWKHFWAWGQENVGSCVFCCSGDLSVSKNNPTQSPEHWWEPPSPLEFPGFQVCERPCVTRQWWWWVGWWTLVSLGCLPWRKEASRWPLQDQAWRLLCFAAFHVVRGSSWEQMTQQPESLGLSSLSAF